MNTSGSNDPRRGRHEHDRGSPLIAIVGAGSHGRGLAAIARAAGEPVEFYDDHVNGVLPVDSVHGRYVIGINDPNARHALWARIVRNDRTPGTLIHPTAVLATGALNPGCVLAALSVVNVDVTLGAHTHVNVGATISQGTVIGEFVTISPGAHICGQVHIGDRVNIGAGAVIKHLVTIGDDVTIGCGTVVINNIPAGMTVAGVPARELVK